MSKDRYREESPDAAVKFSDQRFSNLIFFSASMILGYDVIEKLCFTFHMKRRLVFIEPGGKMPEDGSLVWNRFMILEADYKRKKLLIGFDSGHTDSILDGSWLKRSLRSKKVNVMRTGIGSSSEEDVWVTEKVHINLKGVEVLLEKAEIISGEIVGAASGSLCGLPGMDALEEKVWTMDGRSGYFSTHS